MKINYFGYSFHNTNTNEKFLYDVRPFLKSFCKFDNSDFKNRFKNHDEYLYLSHVIGDIFLFTITRSHELIRRINTNNLSIEDVTSLLSQDEKLGFSSYIMIKENYFSFGSMMLSPKITVFANYINDLLDKIGIMEFEFIPQALLTQATKADIVKVNHVGRTTIELSRDNTFFQDLFNSLSCENKDTMDIDGIEIIIKPKIRKNIKETVVKLIEKIPDEGIEKIVLKAKDDAASQMIDMYLVSKGAVYDTIDKSKEIHIPSYLENKASENSCLKERLLEYQSNESFKTIKPDSILLPNDTSSWSIIVSNIPCIDNE